MSDFRDDNIDPLYLLDISYTDMARRKYGNPTTSI